MPTKLIGNLPNQVPRNADLGTLAFQDSAGVRIEGGAVILPADSGQGYFQDTNISELKPLLLCDFANSKVLDPRITCARASTATYYDGKSIAKAEENLFTYTADMSSFAKTYLTLVPYSAVAPDGTISAASFAPDTTNAIHRVGQNIALTTGLSYTFSVYAKGIGAYDQVFLVDNWYGIFSAMFSLTSGTVVTSSGCTASITSVGNGWYRCVATFTGGANSNCTPSFALTKSPLTGDSYVGDNTVAGYFWGPQLEQRSVVTAYTPTTTTSITNYIPVLQTANNNVPRFDHNPVTGESLGLLIEDAKTNIHLCSSAFDGSTYWVEAGGYRNNATVAPDGTVTASAITEGNTFYTRARSTITFVNGQTYTYSIYAKRGLRNYAQLQIYTSTTNVDYVFDLVNGVYSASSSGAISASMTPVGNGWYRCSVTAQATGTSGYVFTYPANATGYNYTHVQGADSIYVWGAQLEIAGAPSSYIPTTTSQVARTADVVTSSTINIPYSQGTLQLTYTPYAGSPTHGGSIINLYGNSTANGILVYRLTNNSLVRLYLDGSYVSMYNQVDNTEYTFAIKYNNSGTTGYYKGSTTPFTIAGPVPYFTTLGIGGNNGNSSNIQQGWYKKLAIYGTALPTAELQEMTL